MAKTSTPIPAGPAIEMRTPPSRGLRAVEVGLLGIAAIFVVLHFVHLKADFPNHSFWKDWAKFTDEGWYGDAAIRLYQSGHWNEPGDFNPGAALPVWPAILIVLFRFTGVGLVAVRALTVVVFGLTLGSCYFLLRRWMGRASLGPAVVVALLAVSPFYFAFTRLAILEPLLVLLTLVALQVASVAGEAMGRLRGAIPISQNRDLGHPALGAALWTVGLGLLFPAMVLTKTTAVFLFPAILWMLWAATGHRLRAFLRVTIPAGVLGAVVWVAYFELLVRPRYLIDYRYLFSANAYTAFEWNGLGTLLFNTVFDGIWIGKTLFALALVAIVGTIVGMFAKGPRADPLQGTMLLWVVGYGAFLAYHANLQPRYYLVLAVPLTVLVVAVLEPLFVGAVRTWSSGVAQGGGVDVLLLRVTAGAAGAALLFAGVNAGRQTVGFVLHPEYTWVSAAAQVQQAVEREAALSGHSKMVLSISGADLSLMTGLPSICDDFGTMTLPHRVEAYRPGWFATWNEVEDDKMETLAPMYRLERVLTVAAFDDPERNLLILYRLDPVASPGPEPTPGQRRNMFLPRSMRTKIGEQPSVEQLEH